MNQRMLQRLVVTIVLGFLLPCLVAAQPGRPASPNRHDMSPAISRGGGEKGGPGGLWDFLASLFWGGGTGRVEERESASPRGSGKSLLDLLEPFSPNRGTIDPDGNP